MRCARTATAVAEGKMLYSRHNQELSTTLPTQPRTDEDLLMLAYRLFERMDLELLDILNGIEPAEATAGELANRWLRLKEVGSDLRSIIRIIHDVNERFLASPPCEQGCAAPRAGCRAGP
jgi:hypothetical protein